MNLSNKENRRLSLGQIIFTIFYIALWPALMMLASGNWYWTEGWIFSTWFLVMSFTATIYIYIKDPELLKERYRKQGTGNQKTWDKYFFPLTGLSFLAWIILMPLDSVRFGWSLHFPQLLKYAGGVLLALSFFFLFRAFADNTYLSPLVRIQTERKHQLITTGVYSFVRHPMYLGAVLMFFGAPLLMGSYIGMGIGLWMSLLVAIRTLGEEKMLLEELTGYQEYKQKVKYRFIPFIW